MEIKTLYKYVRADDGITVSLTKPDVEYTELFRLVADEGMELVKDDIHAACIDTDTIEGWTEIELQPEEEIFNDEFLETSEE